MEPDAFSPRLLRSYYGAALLVILAAIVTWRSIEPAEAKRPIVRHTAIIRQAAPASARLGPSTAPLGVRRDDRLTYFIVSDIDEQQRINDAMTCNSCSTSIDARGYVAMVNSAQEKATLLRTVNELNWLRRGMSLTPITVVDLSQY